MEPLEMNHSAASFVRLKDSNIIVPHVPINGKLSNQTLPKPTFDAAWNLFQCERFEQAIMQMNNGNTVLRNKQLFSKRA
jgi:hypothetical protein